VPPSAGYLAELVAKLSATPPRLILRNAYNDPKAVEWLSGKVRSPVVVLPFSVGGTPEAKDLFGLFDDTLTRLLGALR
jgi:zinc/manganese transport system substrate-binding protein